MSSRARVAGCVAALLMATLPVCAQIEYGNLNMNLSGSLGLGYGGEFSDPGASGHSINVGGNGYLSGYYYNPNFLSFNLQPYYDRSQNNSESQSIFNSSGVTGNANIFRGSHFPGSISFSKSYNSTGIYGIPGMTGLMTDGSSQGFGIAWSILLPERPSLGVSFSSGSGSSSLLGSDERSESSNRTFSVHSSYTLAGFGLRGEFRRQNNNSTFPNLLEEGEASESNSTSNTYQLVATHKFPLHGSFSSSFMRTTYGNDFAGGKDFGATDTVNASLGFLISKSLPISFTAVYIDNLFGSLEQQLLSGTGELIQSNISPKSHTLNLSASTSYTLFRRVGISGWVTHIRQSVGGHDYGVTQLGGNVNYNFRRFLKGLTVSAGMVDTANQEGNQRVGLVANANYLRNIGGWELNTNFGYDQNTQTLLAVYTTSSLRYSASVRRRLRERMTWSMGLHGSHSGFQQQAGNTSKSEGISTSLSWRRYAVSGFYSQSSGASVLTATGLMPLPLPVPIISAGNLILYNGKSRGLSVSASPMRTLSISGTYTKSKSDTLTPFMISNNGTDMVTARAEYRFRRLQFTAGMTSFRQSISSSGTLPATVTSYYFGLSRWFNFF